MRWIRLLLALWSARSRPRLSAGDESRLSFRVWITDIDTTIMNHAAMMTVMESGRLDLMVRTGFFRQARGKNWYFPSSAISVQFFRPLKLFQKASLSTRVYYANEKWIYLEQTIARKGKPVAICIVKSTIRKGRETVNPLTAVPEIGSLNFPAERERIIAVYEEHNILMQPK